MFIKRTRGGSKEKPIYYLQLVQSYRDESGKPKHRVICTLGREEDLINSGTIDSLAQKFADLSDKFILLDKEKDSLGCTYLLGPLLIWDTLWKRLGIEEILNQVKKNYHIQFNFAKAVKLMVFNRLMDPQSKLSITRWKEKLYGQEFQEVELQHLYRALDLLAENKEKIEKRLGKRTLTLFKPEVKLVFYDLTTIYFESQIVDDLRRFGYSKENRTDCTQVVMGLVLSDHNIPLGYELFPGNTWEGHTVGKVIQKLKRDFSLDKVILVGDKGILSKSTLEEIEKAGCEYIVSAKLPKLKKKYEEEILDRDSYTPVNEDLRVKEMEVEGKRVVLGYSEKRRERDEEIRKALLEKLEKRIGEKSSSQLVKPSYRKYVKFKEWEVEIDQKKVEEASLWDGYFGYYTSNQELTPEEVIGAYKLLWQIEESFRCMKSTLDIRPVYHWTPKRIQGHIMLCFLSFYILRVMQYELKEKGLDIPIERVMESLDEIRAVEIIDRKKRFLVRTAIENDNAQIFRALGIKIPKFILSETVVE